MAATIKATRVLQAMWREMVGCLFLATFVFLTGCTGGGGPKGPPVAPPVDPGPPEGTAKYQKAYGDDIDREALPADFTWEKYGQTAELPGMTYGIDGSIIHKLIYIPRYRACRNYIKSNSIKCVDANGTNYPHYIYRV